ncbi:MFS transporter [Nonomuraea jabiensis]|uniref:Putative MFS family arabinose efflux permease n=1 Tax=Nonomuraea jabiensis TaxID=882448 RepID=A0A7W9LCF2_9ACTN|nr:MFS transporter [Nonomuraea jabiensis]MBB5778468.1 putative MFS family arabinose efflux permease [Nonomuraea jabiensis]
MTATDRTPTERDASAKRQWIAVSAVALGTFLLVTAEQLPIGLLTPVGSALSVSEGAAGLMVTVPSIVAAVAAPVVPILVGRMDRRLLLVALMGLMTLANLASALAPDYPLLIIARVLVGVAIGGFWAIAGGLAVRLVPASRVPRATAIIFGGVGAANVFGVPIGTMIGGLANWRIAFGALSALALAVLVTLLAVLPPLTAAQPVGLRRLAGQFRNQGVRVGILATFLIVTGHFSAYTFISPVLQDLSGIDAQFVGPLLFGFGVAGIAGNFIAGATVAHRLHRTVLSIATALGVIVLLYPVAGLTAVGGVALLVAWGLAYGGVSTSLQTWMIKAAPQAVEEASALWVAVFNLSIGLGAFAGGAIVDALPLQGILWLAGVLLLAAGAAVWGARRNQSLR